MEAENFPYLFAPSFPLASLNSPSLLDQPMQNSQYASSDIDLANMLSSSMANGGENPVFPSFSTFSSSMANYEGENVNKNKVKSGRKKKYIPPRVAFHTRSAEDILDDGYKWRKYGQKAVKNSIHPRSYYRCTHHTCNVKKQIQRLAKDTSVVVTTYEGIHNHPCEKLMETLIPLVSSRLEKVTSSELKVSDPMLI
ncbi:putative WRKY transcription factor 43 [Forsythia ovata]|uniref:WRKY transcription factor 43 n=1 Tax=Forsythia ovata TaxID=205694 RepID=A0ABD1W3M0_9LAMI